VPRKITERRPAKKKYQSICVARKMELIKTNLKFGAEESSGMRQAKFVAQ
jgi:hypothetical protein